MTKAEIVANISEKLGIEKVDVQLTVESLMKEIIDSLENGENVYLRGFGSFIVKKRQIIRFNRFTTLLPLNSMGQIRKKSKVAGP